MTQEQIGVKTEVKLVLEKYEGDDPETGRLLERITTWDGDTDREAVHEIFGEDGELIDQKNH